MDDLKAWIREIAYDRIDQIERKLNASPDVFPEFAAAAGKLDAAMEETDAHPDAKLTERDDLWMTYSAALALEMYLAGARDGGRVYHAFIRKTLGDLKARQDAGEQMLCPRCGRNTMKKNIHANALSRHVDMPWISDPSSITTLRRCLV